MSTNRATYWIAKNQDGKTVIIDNAKTGEDYICFECGTTLKARSIHEHNKYIPHFYHLESHVCQQGKLEVLYWKEKLFQTGDTVTIDGEKYKIINKTIDYNFEASSYTASILIKTESNSGEKYFCVEIENGDLFNVDKKKWFEQLTDVNINKTKKNVYGLIVDVTERNPMSIIDTFTITYKPFDKFWNIVEVIDEIYNKTDKVKLNKYHNKDKLKLAEILLEKLNNNIDGKKFNSLTWKMFNKHYNKHLEEYRKHKVGTWYPPLEMLYCINMTRRIGKLYTIDIHKAYQNQLKNSY